jgi:hypothetical protein
MTKSTKLAVVEKNKGGRPKTILSKDQINLIETELARGMTLKQVGEEFSLPYSTMRDVKRRDEEVSNAYKRGMTNATRQVVGKLWEKIESGSEASIFFWLKTRGGWREKKDIDISNEDGSLKSPSPVLISFVNESEKN